MNEPIVGILTDPFTIHSSAIIKKYVDENLSNTENRKNTFHCYENQLPNPIKNAVHNIKSGNIYSLIKNVYYNENIQSINDMNEIYISCLGANGSDKVFEQSHIDGPFYLLPFCTVMRTILAIQGNSSIITEFPLCKKRYSILTNEFIAFDYNREIHYIWKDESIVDENQRIVLKLHYIITPKFIPTVVVDFYKTIHVKYNSLMRTLFLHSHQDNQLSVIINNTTAFYCWFMLYVGYWNAFMIFCVIYYQL